MSSIVCNLVTSCVLYTEHGNAQKEVLGQNYTSLSAKQQHIISGCYIQNHDTFIHPDILHIILRSYTVPIG